jgi:hypothetical protein
MGYLEYRFTVKPWFSPWNMPKCLPRSSVPLKTPYEHEVRRAMIKLLRTAVFLLCTAVAVPAMAQDYAEGEAAYKAGDYYAALQAFSPLAEQGHSDAQYNLGVMYFLGQGVIQDDAEKADWFLKAAEQGHVPAQFGLGISYRDGDGVLQDAVIAHMWLNISAANGSVGGSGVRGVIEQRMTREQVAEAQALARRCMASDYQDCG